MDAPTPNQRPKSRGVSAAHCLVAAIAALGLFAPSLASAHNARVPIEADSLEVQTAGSNFFSFGTTGQGAILLGHDPATTDTAVMVYGTGPDGGGTGLIDLDRSLWSTIPSGYSYDDPAGTAGGITQVTLQQGTLYVEGGGPNWGWQPAGPQNEVWFHFAIEEEFLCAQFSATKATELANDIDLVRYANSFDPDPCPQPLCGDGVREAPEACDDGNAIDGDGCSSTCDSLECDTPDFDSTFEGIQQVIFSSQIADGGYGCDSQLCHSPYVTGSGVIPPQANLDLTPGKSYSQLINVTSQHGLFAPIETLERVEPSESPKSMLYQVLAARTNGNPRTAPAMPPNGHPLLDDHLEAIEKWIRAGAPEDLVVDGTAGLLGACLPPADPLKLDPKPAMPANGVQLQQTAWDLPSSFEDEVCLATYYDFTQTNLVPATAQIDCPQFPLESNPSGKCFAYNRRVLRQDGQSHHSIIQIYNGDQGIMEDGPAGDEHRKFGPFTFKHNDLNHPNRNKTCVPTDIDPATGFNEDCSGVVLSGATCTGWGPLDAFRAPSFAGSQEPFTDNDEPDGVFSFLPMTGTVIWNSHAFNLTDTDSTMAQYLDLHFAHTADRLYPQRGIFDASKIYLQQVPPFETREYCKTYTLPVDASLYELGSHTHRWGTKFRIWEPPHDPCWPGDTGGVLKDTPLVCPDLDGDDIGDCDCTPDAAGFDAIKDQLLYYSTEYTDPVQLIIDPPMTFGDTVEERTFLFCSEYDNGSTPTSPPVKQQSLSPDPPAFDGAPIPIGGPCPDVDSTWLGQYTLNGKACMGESLNRGKKCGAENEATFCETEAGEGDGAGLCDACDVMGGFTTEDEMFILLGSWYRASDGPIVDVVAPDSALQGQTIDLRVLGRNTSWNDDSQLSFGHGVHVNTATVDSGTEIQANVTVEIDALAGLVDVMVVTPVPPGAGSRAPADDEILSMLDSGFEILRKNFLPLPADGKISGCLEPGEDLFYEFASDGMENMSVKIAGRNAGGAGRLRSVVSLVDPDGLIRKVAKAKNGKKAAKARKVSLVKPGPYLLHVAGTGGKGGCFSGVARIRGDGPRGGARGATSGGSANRGTTGAWKVRECIATGADLTIPFTPKQGAKLGLKLKGKARGKQNALAPKVTLVRPGGFEQVLGSRGKKTKVRGLRLLLGGQHELRIESSDPSLGGCFEAELKLR